MGSGSTALGPMEYTCTGQVSALETTLLIGGTLVPVKKKSYRVQLYDDKMMINLRLFVRELPNDRWRDQYAATQGF